MVEGLFILLMCAVGGWVAFGLTRDRLRRRRVRRLLASRPQLPDDAFAKAYFSDSPWEAQVAVELRQLLEENLSQRLDGLHPDDRLEEDLYAELYANPHLFWEVERQFGVIAPFVPLSEGHDRLLERLRTFRDLVDYVVAETPRRG